MVNQVVIRCPMCNRPIYCMVKSGDKTVKVTCPNCKVGIVQHFAEERDEEID